MIQIIDNEIIYSLSYIGLKAIALKIYTQKEALFIYNLSQYTAEYICLKLYNYYVG